MAVPDLKEAVNKIKEFQTAQPVPGGSQQTPSSSEETRSIADNVQRLTDEATNGNSLDTHDHTAEALLNTAISTLNAIHTHLITNLNVQLSTINAGGGSASLANPNLFASRNTDDYVAGWTEIKKGTTRLADALEAGVLNSGPRAVNTGALSTTLGVDERRTSMAVSAGVQENKALNLSVVETALGTLSTMTGDFAADMDALIASTSNAVQKGTLQAFKDNIELAAGSSGIATSNLMDYARAVINADAQIKTQSDRYDTIAESVAEINTLFDDTNAILSEAQDKMKEYQDAGIAIPESLLTTYQNALQQQKAMSATYGAEVHKLFQEFQDEAKTSKALKETALANATAGAAPGTSQADIQIAANREYERLQGEWIDQMERLVDAIETGASATITAADRVGRHDNTGSEAVTIGTSAINPTNMRAEALATNRAIDQSASDGNWDAMINRVAELQDVFGKLSGTISGFGSALSGLTDSLPAEFGQTVGQLQGEVQRAQNNYRQITQAGQNLSKAGSQLAEMGAQAGGRIGNAANLIGRGMQTAGSLLARAAIPLTAALSALQVIHGAFKEMQGLWPAQSQAAEATRQLTAGQGSDRRLRTQTDLTALAQARAQSADRLASQSTANATTSAQNALTGTSGVAQQQERLIELETERLKLAEQNALIGKQTEQYRINAEKELQNSQAQRQQQSKLTFKDGFWTGNQLIDGSGRITADKDELGLGGTGTGRQIGVAGGALSGAALGAVLGSFIPVLGTAIGATVGGVAGMMAGGTYDSTTSNRNETDAQRQSRLNQESILAHADAAWTTKGDESLKRNIQSAVDDFNKETFQIEQAKFQQLNAELDEVTAGAKAFANVLPVEEMRKLQASSQAAVDANLQLAQSQSELDQIIRTQSLSVQQLKTESEREREGYFWNTKSYERVVGTDELGNQVIAVGTTFEAFQKDLEKKTAELKPVLEARNETAKQEAEQRRRVASLESHNGEILGKAAIATRTAVDALNNALVDLAKQFDDFRLSSAKEETAFARNTRFSFDNAGSVTNARREQLANQTLENTFTAERTATAHLSGDQQFQLQLRQEQQRFQSALSNRQIENETIIADLKQKQAIDLFQLARSNETKLYQSTLDRALQLHNIQQANSERLQAAQFAGVEAMERVRLSQYASGRGPTLESKKTETLAQFDATAEQEKVQRENVRATRNLDEQHRLEKQQLEAKAAKEEEIAKKKAAREIASQERQQKFELELIQIQHQLRMESIEAEYQRRFALERAIESAHAQVTDANQDRIKQARAENPDTYRGVSDKEVLIREQANDSARLKQEVVNVREFANGNTELAKLFEKGIASAGSDEVKLATFLKEFKAANNYRPENQTAADKSMLESATTNEKAAKRELDRLNNERETSRDKGGVDSRIQIAQAAWDTAKKELEATQKTVDDNKAKREADSAKVSDVCRYETNAANNKALADAVSETIKNTRAKELSVDDRKTIMDSANTARELGERKAAAEIVLTDKNASDTDKAKAETTIREVERLLEALGKKLAETLETAGHEKGTIAQARMAVVTAAGQGAMAANTKAGVSADSIDAKELAVVEAEARQAAEKQTHEQRMKDAAEEHRYTLANISARAQRERELNREVINDKLRGDLNRIDSQSRIESGRNETTLATSMLSSKSGIDRMRAVANYRTSEEFNQMNTALLKRQKMELESLLDRGGTESQKMALEDRHAEEKARLDNEKAIRDAVISGMGNIGLIRGLVGDNVGGTSSMQEAWNRAEQSSFAHLKDPTADAITLLNRNLQLTQANIAGILVDNLPKITAALAGGQGAQLNMIRQYISEDGGLV